MHLIIFSAGTSQPPSLPLRLCLFLLRLVPAFLCPLFDFFLFFLFSVLFSLPFVFEQDILEYKKKQRPQKIKMLDGAVKTIMVDDSKTVGELLVTICSRIGTFTSPFLHD